jgi:hypothetical protein
MTNPKQIAYVRELLERVDRIDSIDDREALMIQQFASLNRQTRRIYIQEVAAEAIRWWDDFMFTLSSLCVLIRGSQQEREIDTRVHELTDILRSLSYDGGDPGESKAQN